jgi:hypothetical protein
MRYPISTRGLNIASNYLGDKGALALASELASSRYARDFYIDTRSMNAPACALALVLPTRLTRAHTHSTLTKVDARDNRLEDEGRNAPQQAAGSRF